MTTFRGANPTSADLVTCCLACQGTANIRVEMHAKAGGCELGGVDFDLAVEDDVLPLDRARVCEQFWVEREARRGCEPLLAKGSGVHQGGSTSVKERDNMRPLGGWMQLDDAYWCGQRRGGKSG